MHDDFEIVQSEKRPGIKVLQPANGNCHFYLDYDATRKVCDAITGDPSIEEVNLYRVKFKHDWSKEQNAENPIDLVADMIRETKSVKSINLGRNRLGYDGESFSRICHALKENTSLEEVVLSRNFMNGYSCDTIRNPRNYLALCDMIAENKTITDLDIGDHSLYPFETYEHQLRDALAKNNKLKYFTFDRACSCTMDDDMFKDMMDGLAENQSIFHVSLRGSVYSHECAKMIVERLLSCNPRITELYIGDHRYGSRCPTNTIFQGLTGLKDFSRLRQLDISENTVLDAELLAEYLEGTDTLEYLNLSETDLDDEQFAALERGLCNQKGLTRLNLYCSRIGSEGAKCLGVFICKNTIKHLCLMGSDLEDDGVMGIILDAVLVNTSLEEFDISYSSLSHIESMDIAEKLGRIFSQHPNLKGICIGGCFNNVNHDSKLFSVALLGGLENNTVLKTIDMKQSSILFVDAICKMIRTNKGIKAINLDGCSWESENNNFTESALVNILEALETNTSMEEISLRHHNWTDALAEKYLMDDGIYYLKTNKRVRIKK